MARNHHKTGQKVRFSSRLITDDKKSPNLKDSVINNETSQIMLRPLYQGLGGPLRRRKQSKLRHKYSKSYNTLNYQEEHDRLGPSKLNRQLYSGLSNLNNSINALDFLSKNPQIQHPKKNRESARRRIKNLKAIKALRLDIPGPKHPIYSKEFFKAGEGGLIPGSTNRSPKLHRSPVKAKSIFETKISKKAIYPFRPTVMYKDRVKAEKKALAVSEVKDLDKWEEDELIPHRDGSLYIPLRMKPEWQEKIKLYGKEYGEFRFAAAAAVGGDADDKKGSTKKSGSKKSERRKTQIED